MPVRPTDTHRMMIQTIMSRRHVPDDVAQELYKRCIKAVRAVDAAYSPLYRADKNGTRSFVLECSSILESQDLRMEIRVVVDEDLKDADGKAREVYVLVNTDGSDGSKGMSDYEPLQISYYREVVDAIIVSYPANSIGAIQASNLVSKLQGKLTKTNADNLLKSFVARGWLTRSKRSRYSLSPRAIAELDNWLTSEYDDYMQKCGRCGKTVLSGVVCSVDNCESHIHGSCYAFLQEAPTPKCPSCKSSFDDNPPNSLGEKTVPHAQDNFETIRGKRKRPSRARARDEDEVDELEDEEGMEEDDLEYADVE